jgi:hypothetical protein
MKARFNMNTYEMVGSLMDTWVVMNDNQHAGSMKQSRHNIFEQNPCLIKKLAKKCSPLELPSRQGIDDNQDERGIP